MNRQRLYFNAYKEALMQAVEHEGNEAVLRECRKKIALYGVRYIAIMPQSETRKEAESDLQFISLLKKIIAEMPLIDFMNVFPIKKEYDGEKWGVKDYFYTIEQIKEMDPAAKIGDNLDTLLMEYWNEDIHGLFIAMVQVVDDINHYERKPSLASMWAADIGLMTDNVVEHGGKKFLIEHGKPHLIGRQRPTHLQVIK